MARPQQPELSATLIAHFERLILSGALPAGTRIEPIRALQERFGISYSAARRGVAELVRRGMLTKAGKQILAGSIGHPGTSAIKIVVYMSPNCLPNGSDAPFFPGISLTALNRIQLLALRDGVALEVIPRLFRQGDELLLPEAAKSYSGIIMIQEFDADIDCFSPPLPMVGILMRNSYFGRISLVDLDAGTMAQTAAAFFRQHGKREVEVIAVADSVYADRAERFRCCWEKATGRAPLIHYWDKTFPIPFDYAPERGYLFVSDTLLQHYSNEYAKSHGGVTLPEAHTVLGVDGKRLISPDFHRFPTIAADWGLIGEAAYEECVALIRQPGRPRRRIEFPGRPVDEHNVPIAVP